MAGPIESDFVHREIDELLLSGRAASGFDAEEQFLDTHLADLARLALELDDEAFERHEAIKLLMAHGSRRWEDALP